MITNASATLYSRQYDNEKRMDVWKNTFIDKVWWHESEASVITTEGLKSADVFVIRIPDTSIVIKKDDYLVKGECGIDVTSVKDLKGMKYCKVTSANYNIFGSNQHIKVGGV